MLGSSFVLLLLTGAAANLDRFNYDSTSGRDYGPEDWNQVGCDNLRTCLGWPDSWEMAIDWSLTANHCDWCPAENDGRCGTHHQSPIDLERNRAVEGHEKFNQCIDVHWMAYYDSSCDFDTLVIKKAFSVERHALKIVQPLKEVGQDKYALDCANSGRWGQIDFSKGFSQWWHLSHTDFHVPSEHTQEGKRYAGEIQMYHWYSVNASVAGINNEMAAVSVFIESYDDTPDYDVLNRVICQWRKAEDRTREECNMDSVQSEYPGCFYNRRGHALFNTTLPDIVAQGLGRRELRGETRRITEPEKPLSAHDIILHNWKQQQGNTGQPTKIIRMSPKNFEPADPDFDWDSFIASQYTQDESITKGHQRKLIDYNHVGPWFNYFPMLGVRTEYYFRYSGAQTVPPCYGRWIRGNNRRQTNHWRVMKDPLRVSLRQLGEMHRLLKERIAPLNDPVNPCQPDTGAKQDATDPSKVNVARPIQSTRPTHFKTFCECENWRSKWKEDQAWCKKDKTERFYNHPYNFETEEF